MIQQLTTELYSMGARFVKAVDISKLEKIERRDFTAALIIGVVFSPEYVHRLLEENIVDKTGFSEKEREAESLGDWTADYLQAMGYDAFSQSENNLILNGLYNKETKISILPHKKIAVMAGLGFIGKNDLLVTQDYGSAFCMSTVLTNAPLSTENKPMILPKCGTCTICQDNCPGQAIKGTLWKKGMSRDLIIDISRCDFCLKCLVNCPWTKKYMQTNYLPE